MGAPTGFRSRLAQILASGAFAVTAEVTPNASRSADQTLGQVGAMKGYADAFNVTDCTRALVRISSLAASALLLREDVEPVTQMVTRDRNRIALQADVLGAHALGVRNLLCLRGDDPKVGNEPDAAPVFEYTTEQFLALAQKLRGTGALAGGGLVGDPPNPFLGAGGNPRG